MRTPLLAHVVLVTAIVKRARRQVDVKLVLLGLRKESADASDANQPSSSIGILVLTVQLNTSSAKHAIFLHASPVKMAST